ncbi:MAG: S41 family peptidase, partial [Candidatus Promineifilaceae bacterium]
LAFTAIGGYMLGKNTSEAEEDDFSTAAVEENDIQQERLKPLPPDEDTAESEQNAGGIAEVDSRENSTSDVQDQELVEEEKAQEGTEETALEQQEKRIPIDPEAIDKDLLIEVWEIINREFDGILPTTDEITYEAINGSIDLLDDQYSRFLPPDVAERARIQIQGGYEGIGAYVDLTEDGDLLIVRPIDGQPADEAGVRGGDVVTEVDGEVINGMTLAEIVALVTGPRGTDVTLTLYRSSTDEILEFTITRQRIEFPIVISRMLDEDIGYVRLTSFSVGAQEQLGSAIEELLKSEPIGLILDLRDNPGGLLAESIEVSDLFLPEGVVAYQRDNKGNEKVFESADGDLAEGIALVILVNEGSASASEIVAGAVHDQGRGVLIGENTLGKGSVQQSYTLSDGSELRVTVAKWYTPNNVTIGGEGIAPDIQVNTPEDLGTEDDIQLNRAIEFLLELNSGGV